MRYTTAESKAEASARMYLLGNRPIEPLGPGSKEKKSALVALGAAIGLDLTAVPGKSECGRTIAAHVGARWDAECCSTGDTITTRGMNTLVDAAVAHLLRTPGALTAQQLAAVVAAARSTPPVPPEESVMPVARNELEQNIAGWLAVLTRPGPAPTGVKVPSEALDPEAVRFEDGSWRSVLVDVQGWLHLPAEVATQTPEDFYRALAGMLGEDAADLDALLERIAGRLERAVALREAFLEEVEGTDEGRATVETATQNWVDAWDEVEDDEEAEVGGPIKAQADVWAINEFVQRASDDELNLSPSYQRADVWPTGDSQMLIESVLRGIPLPSIILLQHSEGGVTYEVVDGKQRLTSLLRFMGFHPRALEVVRAKATEWDEPGLVELFQRDYPAFKKKWKQHEQQRLTAQLERELYFPFALRSGEVKPLSGNLEAVRGKYYSEIRDVLIDVVGRQQRVKAIFEMTTTYKVPVILYEEVSSEQIHEVFSLYNKQGKHLNAEEIRNALFHHLPLMRGLLVTAGDADDVGTVAPFLASEWGDLSSTQATLDRYGFGRAGYKRTKLLSWVAAVVFGEEGSVGRRSTAATVNAFLRRVEKSRNDPLRSEDAVLEAMLLLDHGLDAHASVPDEAWAPAFKNAQLKNGWQELQLVSALIALCAAHAVLGDDLVDRLEECAPQILAASSTQWERPSKTQTAEQWRYTAHVVRGVLAILEIDPEVAQKSLVERFGHSGLGSLLAIGR